MGRATNPAPANRRRARNAPQSPEILNPNLSREKQRQVDRALRRAMLGEIARPRDPSGGISKVLRGDAARSRKPFESVCQFFHREAKLRKLSRASCVPYRVV